MDTLFLHGNHLHACYFSINFSMAFATAIGSSMGIKCPAFGISANVAEGKYLIISRFKKLLENYGSIAPLIIKTGTFTADI